MGLPLRVVIPILTIFAVIFLGIMGYLLRIGFGTEGSAFGPSAPHEQGDARMLATALPGNSVGGGPPAPVMAALNDLQTRVAKNPRDTASLIALGSMYFEAGKYDRALVYDQRAIAVNPASAEALFAKAATLRAMGRRTDAIAAYQQYLRIAPSDPHAGDARTAIGELGG